MATFPLPFDGLYTDAPTMRDVETLRQHAEGLGWPQLWCHADGRVLVVTRAHRYIPTPEVLGALRLEFTEGPHAQGDVSVYHQRPTKPRVQGGA
jgi:hypothetical protein